MDILSMDHTTLKVSTGNVMIMMSAMDSFAVMENMLMLQLRVALSSVGVRQRMQIHVTNRIAFPILDIWTKFITGIGNGLFLSQFQL